MMDEQAQAANRLAELPEDTRKFLAELREEDIETLKDGLELVRASRTVGRFVKWLILGILGTVVGTVMLYENVVKVIGWFSPPK